MYLGAVLEPLEDHQRQPARLTPSIAFSNVGLAPCEQFSAFQSVHHGVIDLALSSGEMAAFPARQMVWNLDRMAFMRTSLPGKTHVHRRKHLKKCVLDHWYIHLPSYAHRLGDWRESNPPVPSLHCLGTPFDSEFDHDGMLTLFMPHDLFTSTTGLFRMLDMRFDGGIGQLMADYLFLLSRSLAKLQPSEVPYVVEATRSLVAVCITPSQDRLAEAQAPIDATLLARARKLIDSRLTDRNLTTEMLCAELGTSRSRLYRLFEPLGGIVSYIRKQRLLRTRDALSDITDGRSISRIAEQWGFVDASAYSRMFRHEFGMSPKEARDIGWANNGLFVAHERNDRSDGPQTLWQLLRTVGGS